MTETFESTETTPPEPAPPSSAPSRTREAPVSLGARRALTAAAVLGLVMCGSLFAPWYTYEGFGNEFTTKGWKVLSSIDVLISLAATMAVIALAVHLDRRRQRLLILAALVSVVVVIAGAIGDLILDYGWLARDEAMFGIGAAVLVVLGLRLLPPSMALLLMQAGAAMAIGLIIYRLVSFPYDENYTVTPHAGSILALVCAAGIFLAGVVALAKMGALAAVGRWWPDYSAGPSAPRVKPAAPPKPPPKPRKRKR